MSATNSPATPDTPEAMAARLFEIGQLLTELKAEKEFLNLQLSLAFKNLECAQRFEANGLRAVRVERPGQWSYSGTIQAIEAQLKTLKKQEQENGKAIPGERQAHWRVSRAADPIGGTI